MTDEECIATALLHGACIRMWGVHPSRTHDVWLLRERDEDCYGPAERAIYRETTNTGQPRYYFLSAAEAARYYCKYNGLLQE